MFSAVGSWLSALFLTSYLAVSCATTSSTVTTCNSDQPCSSLNISASSMISSSNTSLQSYDLSLSSSSSLPSISSSKIFYLLSRSSSYSPGSSSPSTSGVSSAIAETADFSSTSADSIGPSPSSSTSVTLPMSADALDATKPSDSANVYPLFSITPFNLLQSATTDSSSLPGYTPDDCESLEWSWWASVQSASSAGKYPSTVISKVYPQTTSIWTTPCVYTDSVGVPRENLSSTCTSSMVEFVGGFTNVFTSVLLPTQPTFSACVSRDASWATEPCICHVNGGNVQVFYWEVTTLPGNASVTVPSNYTGIRTNIVDGITMTSPYIYLKYDQIAAQTIFGNCSAVGSTVISNSVISMLPQDVSTIGLDGPKRYNFVNLQMTPIPTSVYFDQRKCLNTVNCLPIGEYNPQLVVPPQLMSMVPSWSVCVPDFYGSFDPPYQLRPETSLAGPTTPPGNQYSSSASPGVVPPQPPTRTPSNQDPVSTFLPQNSAAKASYSSQDPKQSATQYQPPLPPVSSSAPAKTPIINVGGSVVTANTNNAYVIGSETLSAGGPAVTVGSTTLSMPAAGSAVIINGATTVPQAPAPGQPPVLTIGGIPASVNAAGALIIGSSTVTAGGPAVIISGTTYSLAPSGTAVVVNGLTRTLANAQAFTTAAVITLGGKTYIANSAGAFVIAGQTLTPGGAITVSGTAVSLPPGPETAVFVGTRTEEVGCVVLNESGGSSICAVGTARANYTGPVYAGSGVRVDILRKLEGVAVVVVSIVICEYIGI